MKTFDELKKILLERAKIAGACKDGCKMGIEAKGESDLLKAITTNWDWVLREKKIIDAAFLEENFTEGELHKAGIYTNGNYRISTVAFACGSATVKACGSATVIACGSATVKACGSATVMAYDSATVIACGSATVEAYGSATVIAYDSVTVKACGSATVEAYGNSYVEDYKCGIIPQSDYAIVKDYFTHKIYIKKGKFEVIEIE